jgi:hypothetical protein
MAFRKIRAGLVNSDIDQFIGEIGNLFFDITDGTLRLSDGETPGGVIVGGGSGGSDYTLPTASPTTKGGVKIGSNITITDGVISVAAPFSGSYNDLTNKPTIPSLTGYATETFVTTRGYLTSVGTISYNDLSNKPTLFSGSYTDLTNKPTLFDGAYASLSGKPTLFSGSYTDLTDKPTIPAAQVNSDWNASSGLAQILNKPTLFSGSYADLTNKPTIYSSAYIGTTSLDFTRSSASQTLSGVSIDGSIVWVNSTPAPGDPFRTAISAASGNASISLTSGLPGLGSTVSWTFDTTKITFPNTTTQTTAWTGSSPTLTTARNINGVSFNGSADITVTAAAGTLTGTELKSTVVTSSLTSVGTLTSLTASGLVRFNSAGVGASYNAAGNSVNIGGVLGVASNIYANGNIDIVAGSAYYIGGNTVLNGTTLGSNIVNSSLTSVGTLTSLTSSGSVTANHTTAFIAGDNAISGVALQMPREGALRNTHNGANNNMYFDVSTGGASHGQFQFRSSSAFTNVLTMSPTAFNVNTNAVVTARTPSFGRLAWNSAIDTELTIDDFRFRISNQGGNFPQIISNTGGSKNCGWTVVAARSGSAVTQAGSTGTIVANNAWTSLYTLGGMDSAGDTYVATLQDKGEGRIYRVTFMRSDNGSTTGYNIIAERLL